MKKGQHKLLLEKLGHNLRALGQELSDRLEHAQINSSPPGTPGYSNKLTLTDGFYFAVLQGPGPKNQRNQLAWGYQNDPPTSRCGDTVEWNASDDELRRHAHDPSVLCWAVFQMLTAQAQRP